MQNKMINKVEEIQSYQLNCWSFTAAEKFIFKLQMLIKLLPMKRRINWQIKLGCMLDVFLYHNTQSPKHVIILILSVSQKPLNCICCAMLQMMKARMSLTSSKEACLFLIRWVTMTMTPLFLFNNVTCICNWRSTIIISYRLIHELLVFSSRIILATVFLLLSCINIWYVLHVRQPSQVKLYRVLRNTSKSLWQKKRKVRCSMFMLRRTVVDTLTMFIELKRSHCFSQLNRIKMKNIVCFVCKHDFRS